MTHPYQLIEVLFYVFQLANICAGCRSPCNRTADGADKFAAGEPLSRTVPSSRRTRL